LDKIPDECTYHIEAGDRASEPFQLTGVEPIRLAQGSPGLQVTPPEYVNPAVHPTLEVREVNHLSVLQYSTLRWSLQVTRLAHKSHLVWQREGESPVELPIAWKEGGLHGTVEFPTADKGRFAASLYLEDEHGIVSRPTLPGWTVWSDEPPLLLEPPFAP